MESINKVLHLQYTALICFFLFLVVESHVWNLIGWKFIFIQRYYVFISFVFFAFFFLNILYVVKLKRHFKYCVFFLGLWPMLSLFLSRFWGGVLVEEINRTFKYIPLVFLYFVFAKFKINEKTIVASLITFGVITCIIQIVEQFFPEMAVFGSFDLDDENYGYALGNMRNNLYRFRVGSSAVQLFCLFFFWQKLREKFSLLVFVMLLLFSVSIYLYLTRQIILAVFATLILSFLIEKKIHFSVIIVFLAGVVGLYYYWDVLFGEFIRDYDESGHYTTDIRIECGKFVLQKIFDNQIAMIVGHGHLPVEWNVWYNMGYFLSDIGFIGESFYYGILWAVAYFYMVFNILVTYKNKIPLYVRLFVLCVTFSSIMIFPYHTEMGLIIWACVLYICSLHTNRILKIKYGLS